MKLGIVGTGKIVSVMLESIKNISFEEIQIYGRRKEKARELCDAFHLDGYTDDYDELLYSDLDVFYIAVINSLHYTFALKALEQGKHVIVEKPITASAGELEHLIEVAKTHHCMILEAMTVHQLPMFRELKKQIPRLGRVRIVSLNYSQYSSRYDAFKAGEILPAFDVKEVGGALMDLNVYNIHALLGLFGDPDQVQYRANLERGIDTSGILTLTYSDKQAVSIGAKDCKAPIRSTIQGDEAAAVIPMPFNAFTEFSLLGNDGSEQSFEERDAKPRMYHEFKEFIRIIESKDEKEADRLLGLSRSALKILDLARKDAEILIP